MGPRPAVAEVRLAVRHCLAGFPAGSLVLAACSGGPDSLALAAALAHEGPRHSLRSGAVTVDHGLQEGSARRAQSVAATLAGLGLEPVLVKTVEVAASGAGGPEAAARTARYRALDDAVRETGAVAVLLGHSLDDQAETVLLGLARGAGARSLAGMPASRGHYRRPLLGVERATLRAACDAQGLVPWEDPHNSDPSFARARVRHKLMPVLEAELGPGISQALARTAAQLRADADALDELATEQAQQAAAEDGQWHVDRLAALPPALRARVLHQAAVAAGCPPGALSARHVAAMDSLVTQWHGQRWTNLPGGVRAMVRYGKLLFASGED
ncbi:MAG TPA: tRNA lysidine(34) synthetase TilS [Streptosporangiaceae bacterium]|nr:tRNA lysidine(34) synthetase TilS [Streptosporangiaceae bacterium]